MAEKMVIALAVPAQHLELSPTLLNICSIMTFPTRTICKT